MKDLKKELEKYKKLKTTEKDTLKYKNAKKIMQIYKEYPDFLYGLMSKNEYDNDKGITKKFNKIINNYENNTWYECPECKGKKGISRDAGFGAFGEPCTDWIKCKYCNGNGKLKQSELKSKILSQRQIYKDKYNILAKRLGYV